MTPALIHGRFRWTRSCVPGARERGLSSKRTLVVVARTASSTSASCRMPGFTASTPRFTYCDSRSRRAATDHAVSAEPGWCSRAGSSRRQVLTARREGTRCRRPVEAPRLVVTGCHRRCIRHGEARVHEVSDTQPGEHHERADVLLAQVRSCSSPVARHVIDRFDVEAVDAPFGGTPCSTRSASAPRRRPRVIDAHDESRKHLKPGRMKSSHRSSARRRGGRAAELVERGQLLLVQPVEEREFALTGCARTR